MATKPDAARGKTTTKGKLKKAVKAIMERSELIGDPSKGKGMSPGAMGGKTVEDMDLSKMRQRVDAIGKLLSAGTLGGVAGTMSKKLKKEFDDGGAVDMTTEVDVE
tara:strand:- start:132 stop:449 length:318 start_codon:yes stop_codon:yes gene_type:complete